MKTPSQYAKHLKNEIGIDAAKFLCNTMIRLVDKMDDPEKAAFDCLGKKEFDFESEFSTHLTGYDLKAFFKQVKRELTYVD